MQCDPTIGEGFQLADMAAAVKSEVGRDCAQTRQHWGYSDQPCYVSGAGDNYDKCLGTESIPSQVLCSGSHDRVMRWCKCQQARCLL